MSTKASKAFTKVLRKYMGFYDTYVGTFKDFLSALDALSNAELTHHIIDLITLER